jgi:integrase
VFECDECHKKLEIERPSGKRHFCSGCESVWNHKEYFRKSCGPLHDFFKDHVRPFADRYEPHGRLRFLKTTAQFFECLIKMGVTEPGKVLNTHVSAYAEALKHVNKKFQVQVAYLNVFFGKLEEEGLHPGPNPAAETVQVDEALIKCVLPVVAVDPARLQFIEPNTRICSRPGCRRFVPEGEYPKARKLLFCNAACEKRFLALRGRVKAQCEWPGCKTTFLSKPKTSSGQYLCRRHSSVNRTRAHDEQDCGPFSELLRFYFRIYNQGHYEHLAFARSEIRMFFKHLGRCRIDDIGDVRPHHVASFLKMRGGKSVARADYVKTMFDYLILTERYREGNPVLPRVMYKRGIKRGARPYDSETLELIWSLLKERGTTQARFAIAFGEECGQRISEVCGIRLCDVDQESRQIYIADSKNDWVGYVPYGVKTEKWLKAWNRERPSDCKHKYLLVNANGDPMRTGVLRNHLKGILCSRSAEDRGLESFHYHRLRHTNSTNLDRNGLPVEESRNLHRWGSDASPLVYIAPPPWEQDKRDYDAAMEQEPRGL